MLIPDIAVDIQDHPAAALVYGDPRVFICVKSAPVCGNIQIVRLFGHPEDKRAVRKRQDAFFPFQNEVLSLRVFLLKSFAPFPVIFKVRFVFRHAFVKCFQEAVIFGNALIEQIARLYQLRLPVVPFFQKIGNRVVLGFDFAPSFAAAQKIDNLFHPRFLLCSGQKPKHGVIDHRIERIVQIDRYAIRNLKNGRFIVRAVRIVRLRLRPIQ